jgi:hypothetical protein
MDDGFHASRRPIECALWLTRLCMDTTGEIQLNRRDLFWPVMGDPVVHGPGS